MNRKFKRLDLSHARNVYVVGDIHGCFSLLETELEKIGFDRTQDHLISVGDLVDRGPESERVLEFLDYPWFHAVQGNHDEWTAARSERREHRKHGGKWFWKLFYNGNSELHYKIATALGNLPVLMEAHLPDGKKIGIAHACYPFASWRGAEDNADFFETEIKWGRRHLGAVEAAYKAGNESYVDGIDHVYYGHTPMAKPFTSGNQSWIDTGACWDDGYFTIVKANV